MFLQRGSRALRSHSSSSSSKAVARLALGKQPQLGAPRWFSQSKPLHLVKPVLLADIGEGIVECEVIQWFVQPGARVEEFSPLCEVQSDKASVEITSRFTGTVKKLYYDAGEMAKVGKPFVDIDIQAAAAAATQADETAPTAPAPTISQPVSPAPVSVPTQETSSAAAAVAGTAAAAGTPAPAEEPAAETKTESRAAKGKGASIATPAVRHLSKELKVDIGDIEGTGRDGRVTKEDILKFAKCRQPGPTTTPPTATSATSAQVETRQALTPTQQIMFKTMSRSLSIPHFLYADEVDFTDLVRLRTRLNKVLAKDPSPDDQPTKLSYLPFIIKAVSLALYRFPILNARVELDPPPSSSTSKPALVMRSQHNIGVAMDAPQGLVVPVIRNVGALNIVAIAAELVRLQRLASTGRLAPADLAGGTITVSNIGSIGGTYLSPVIVEREVAILGIGRMRTVPAFEDGDGERIVRKQVCNFSWSADHRVVDGATMARAADVVRGVVEEPDVMVMHLR